MTTVPTPVQKSDVMTERPTIAIGMVRMRKPSSRGTPRHSAPYPRAARAPGSSFVVTLFSVAEDPVVV